MGAAILANNGSSLGVGGPNPVLKSMTGTAGGVGGTGMTGPQAADLKSGTSAVDLGNAQTGTANSLASQNALLSALQGQNGLAQQNNVLGNQQALANKFNNETNAIDYQKGAMGGQRDLNAQLAAANGVGTQNQAIQGLQGTAGMYQNIAEGKGPNPAQAMLNQQTGQNVANQSAMMAGQRGAGANVGLMARQAAQQGAATQQQAVGQGATMQANQQLNALSGLQGAQQAIGNMGTTQANMQASGLGQQANMAGQQIAAQQAANQAAANQANVMAGQQIAGTQANTQAQMANLGAQQGAQAAYNSAVTSGQGSVNAANAGLATTAMQGQQGLAGGVLNGAGAVMGLAGGGEVQHYDVGGTVAPAIVPAAIAPIGATPPPAQPMPQTAPPPGPSSSFGQFLKGWGSSMEAQSPSEGDKPISNMGGQSMNAGASNLGKGIASRAKGVPMDQMSKGGLAAKGGHVKAKSESQKPVKAGDSLSNDKVPAMLSEGEIVIPRSVATSKDPVRASADFVQKVLAKRRAS